MFTSTCKFVLTASKHRNHKHKFMAGNYADS